MNKVVGFLTLCVVLAIIKAALMALVVALLLGLLFSFITRPRDTIVFAGSCALSCLAVAQPLAFIAGVTIVALAIVLQGQRRKSPKGRGSTVLIGTADDQESGG